MLIKSKIIMLKKIMIKIVVDINDMKANLEIFLIKFTKSEIEHKIRRTLHFELQKVYVPS